MLERDLLALQAWKAESDRAEMVARADVEETMREMRGRMTAMALSQQQILRDENKALSIANQALRQLLQSTDCPNKTRPKELSETMSLFISWPMKNAFGHSLSPAEVIEHIKIYGTIESWTQTDIAKAGKTELLVRMSSFLEVKRLVAANLRLRCTELQISLSLRDGACQTRFRGEEWKFPACGLHCWSCEHLVFELCLPDSIFVGVRISRSQLVVGLQFRKCAVI